MIPKNDRVAELEEALRREKARRLTDIVRKDRRITQLEEKVGEFEDKVEELLKKIAELSRAGKRQATPFARKDRKAKRKKPGAKAGHAPAWRPAPAEVDEEVEAPLDGCPCCGGGLEDLREHEQFVVDLPEVKPFTKRVVTYSGFCKKCKKRVRSRHPDQVSTAGGAAKVALGPRALGMASEFKHRLGVPYRDIADVFGRYFSLTVTHGALVHATVRVADRALPLYAGLVHEVRAAPVVNTDDTGWRIDGMSCWLWVFATPETTVYFISASRGSGVVTSMLGPDFGGILVSDGLPALDALDYRRSQCLGHLVVRASELAANQHRGAVRFPRAIKENLKRIIALPRERAELTERTFAGRARRLEVEMDKLLAGDIRSEENRKLANHMRGHRDQLLVCLKNPAVPATNNLAEQQLRGAVVIRKIGGCNRSPVHAGAHAVISSVAQTAYRRGGNFADVMGPYIRLRDGPRDRVLAAL